MKNLAARRAGLLTVVCTFGLIAVPGAVHAQLFQRWCQPCVPCPTAPSPGAIGQPGTTGGTGAAAQPGGEAGQAPAAEAPSDLLAYSGAGAASGPESVGLNMVGDYLGGFVTMTGTGFGGGTQVIPLPGGAISRFKMAEDTSPMPTDRAYFIYDDYNGVPYNGVASSNTINVNGFTPGFEKTFLDGAMSVEVRVPMATTLSNTIYLNGTTPTGEGEIGNVGVSIKALLYRSDTVALSGGLCIDCPTSPTTVCVGDGSAIQILNQSVHLLPFFGGLWTPNDRLFAIGFLQMDIDANGDTVNNDDDFDGTFSGNGQSQFYREQTMLYLDGTVGYWIRRNDCSGRFLTGIALFSEFHLDQSLDTSAGPTTVVGTMSGNNISILDTTGGAVFQIGPCTTVTTAFCMPLTTQREFNSQFRLLLERRF